MPRFCHPARLFIGTPHPKFLKNNSTKSRNPALYRTIAYMKKCPSFPHLDKTPFMGNNQSEVAEVFAKQDEVFGQKVPVNPFNPVLPRELFK